VSLPLYLQTIAFEADADGLLSAIYIMRNPDKLGHVRGQGLAWFATLAKRSLLTMTNYVAPPSLRHPEERRSRVAKDA